MKSNEIRVGNIVSKGDEWFIADHLTILMAHLYNPIPLTHEILEACGFIKVNDKENIYQTVGGNYQILFSENRNSIFYIYIDEFKGYCYACGILYYLHQLQNLIFSLTDEELKINL